MKNALIDPGQNVSVVTGWNTKFSPPLAITEAIPNSARVAQVDAETFPVADPLFWTPCADDVVADQFYYNTDTKAIIAVPAPPPVPAEGQPTTSGTQSL